MKNNDKEKKKGKGVNRRKKYNFDKIVQCIISVILPILTIVSIVDTYVMNVHNKKNLNINYELLPYTIKPELMKRNGTSFNVKPYMFNLIRETPSGEYLKGYFARIDKNKENALYIRELEADGTCVYINNDPKDTENSSNQAKIKNNQYNADITIYYADKEINMSVQMFHIILVGYDGSEQIFTIIYYPTQIIKQKDEFGETNFIFYDCEIVKDYEIYTSDRLQDIILRINETEYKNNNPFASFKKLQDTILEERTIIKKSLNYTAD